MAMPAATASAKSLLRKLFFHSSSTPVPKLSPLRFYVSATIKATHATLRSQNNSETKQKQKQKQKQNQNQKQKAELLVKRRTRSERELDEEGFSKHYGNDNSAHVPVMLGEVLDVFASLPLKSFVDCTLGAGGHSAAIIHAHPEMELYVGLDVDPVALQIAQSRINDVLQKDYDCSTVDLQVNNAERGFSVLCDGPLDMRMNPQASLKAEDILNLWPDAEVGRILRDYGEESNWFSLQKKIVKARLTGGLHCTQELVDLIRSSTSWTRGGRQGWIKTATRVFQALRIAVNDELNTLKDSIYSCFDCLGSGGRLAIITFHSLEDRIVKQAFLDIVNRQDGGNNKEGYSSNCMKYDMYKEKEAWIKQMVQGPNACVLTKRPITPSESEERFNPRSRSAKLRAIEKI